MEIPGLTHHSGRINGIRMHWVEAGEGAPVVLCHGFPHTWKPGTATTRSRRSTSITTRFTASRRSRAPRT